LATRVDASFERDVQRQREDMVCTLASELRLLTDHLVFRFLDVHEDAELRVTFQRPLRVECHNVDAPKRPIAELHCRSTAQRRKNQPLR